jgi:hypothetical protein
MLNTDFGAGSRLMIWHRLYQNDKAPALLRNTGKKFIGSPDVKDIRTISLLKIYFQDAWIWFLTNNLRADPCTRLRDSYQGVAPHLRAPNAISMGSFRYFANFWYMRCWTLLAGMSLSNCPLTTVNCYNMKMTNHNFTPKRIIFPKTIYGKKCISAWSPSKFFWSADS